MNLLNKFLDRTEFDSYEDFYENYNLKYNDDFNFGFDVVDEYARICPEKQALVWCDDEGRERKFNYGELSKYTNKTANYFKSLGIKKGDMVMLILKRHYEFWFSIIALHKLGAVTIPATHLLTKKDVVYRCNSAKIKMIVCADDDVVTKHIEDSLAESPTVKAIVVDRGEKEGWHSFEKGVEAASDVFERPTGDEKTSVKDTMLLYFTSGTTGEPKMVCHNFAYPLGHIPTAAYWHNVKDDGLHLTVADTGWGKAVWGKLYGQMIAGTGIFIYDYSSRFEPSDLLKMVEKYQITTFCAPPTIYRFFIKADLTKFNLSSLTHCTTAGEALNPEVYKKFLEATGLKLYEGFGQTESCLSLATYKWETPHTGSMGKPSPYYKAYLLNDEGEVCDPGQTGEIVFDMSDGAPIGVFSGYLYDEEKTKEVLDGKYYHTGDLAWCDEDGFYWYVGRVDDVIKSSGYRIGPFEVESALMEHPAVFETAITAVPDEIRGQVVKATIVLAKGYTPSDELVKELQNHVKRTTAPYKYPRIIEFADELPKTISGKIRRVELREKDNKKK
ncbi:AMP-binding protein [Qingrenia yutianensis]|uniref:AMP-binding protein n=1 Tax=Qingrenia yutianensis TaxID=2763676 RepID=A0A926ITJ7_9FIRM|nr:AMP-binding protein [Qingrenia yutianensis]MBC8597181.1 AMP-binding protein [Qingrenia yutianensis]